VQVEPAAAPAGPDSAAEASEQPAAVQPCSLGVSAANSMQKHTQQHNTALTGSLQQQQQVRLLSVGTGCWLSHLDFDGQRYWTLSEDPPEQWLPLSQQQQQQQGLGHASRGDCLQQHPQGLGHQQQQESGPQQQCVLPSDSQQRQDLVALRAGDVWGAQQLKEHMEQQQRHDAKARPAFPHLDCVQSS
jgi:hypothetical protein